LSVFHVLPHLPYFPFPIFFFSILFALPIVLFNFAAPNHLRINTKKIRNMEAVFGYIIGLGAAVMMPIIFTILGVCIKIKFGKALQSGLYVGVGFVGLSVITALLTSSLSPSLSKVVEIYDLNLEVFDMGWPAAAAAGSNTAGGAGSIPRS